MEHAQLVILFSKLVLGAIATFLAIMLWSRTRDTAWMLIVIGTIVAYADVVFTTLDGFGIVRSDLYAIAGVPAVQLIGGNLPTAFYISAFLVMLFRKRYR
jgi:hypothetical protein